MNKKQESKSKRDHFDVRLFQWVTPLKYEILNTKEVPERHGWTIGMIIGNYKAHIIICRESVQVLYEIAHVDFNGTFFSSKENILDDEGLATVALKKIDVHDLKRWPEWDAKEINSNGFWTDYMNESRNIIIVNSVIGV